MDRITISALAHADHPVASPLNDDTVDQLLDQALIGHDSVLDLGCGDGTWLLRALRRHPQLRAIGVDIADAGFARVRDEAERAGLASRLELHQADASDWKSLERFDVVLSVGATHAFGGLLQTLAAASEHLRPGGVVVIGECFWEQSPSTEALDLLGAGLDDYANLSETVDTIITAGWVPLHGHVSSLQEWDAYEWSWTGSLTRWAVDHPNNPNADQVHKTAAQHRRTWLKGYRRTLGFVTLLVTPTPPHLAN